MWIHNVLFKSLFYIWYVLKFVMENLWIILYIMYLLIGYTRQYYVFYVTVNYVKLNLTFYNVIDQNTYNRYVIIVKKNVN